MHGSAGGGIKFWKIGVSGETRAGISGTNREQENYNRIYGDIRRAQDSLLEKLSRGEIKKEEFVSQYTKTFQDYATEADRLVREKTDEHFGASGMVTRPFGSDRLGEGLSKGYRDWPGAWGKGLIEDKKD